MAAHASVMERLEALGRISEEPDRLNRPFATDSMRRANELAGSWMAQAGLKVRRDALGNLIGHRPGPRADAKVLLLGSHLDTVRNAGKFDGPLGVVLAIACVEQLKNQTLPFAIEVIGFADEEGARYQTAYLGSRALTGQLTETDLARLDANGVAMADAIREFGGDPARLKSCRMAPENLLGYVEVHIEQGPVLEQKNHSVGVVNAIAGQTRARVVFRGRAAHAGTTPMELRQDALCAAAEFILTVEKQARSQPGLVATVGQIAVEPNISNVIPETCCLTVDIRHQDDAIRAAVGLALQAWRKAGIEVEWRLVQETASVPCSAELSTLLRAAAGRHQKEVINLPSGAGHDAAILAQITPVAMLFVRCRGGISHHPDESVSGDDVQIALQTLVDFVLALARRENV